MNTGTVFHTTKVDLLVYAGRWLSVEPASNRALQLFDSLQEYINVYIPKNDKDLGGTKSYEAMKKYLKNPHKLKAELHFLCSSAHLFTKVTGFFQKSEPLIHRLYSELHSLVTTLSGRVCKPGTIQNCSLESVFDDENLLPVSSIICSDDVSKELTLSKVSNGCSCCFTQYLRLRCLLNLNLRKSMGEKKIRYYDS